MYNIPGKNLAGPVHISIDDFLQYFPIEAMHRSFNFCVSVTIEIKLLSCGDVYYAVQGGSKFWVCGCGSAVLSCGAVFDAAQDSFYFEFWNLDKY